MEKVIVMAIKKYLRQQLKNMVEIILVMKYLKIILIL